MTDREPARLHVVEVMAVAPKLRVTYATFETQNKAIAFAWWALHRRYRVRYFTSGLLAITASQREMLDKLLELYYAPVSSNPG